MTIHKFIAIFDALIDCLLITKERVRQIAQEGWTPEHDDEHAGGLLVIQAAALCVSNTQFRVRHFDIDQSVHIDPFGLVKKHHEDRLRQLEIAGALVAAERQRIRRLRTYLRRGFRARLKAVI